MLTAKFTHTQESRVYVPAVDDGGDFGVNRPLQGPHVLQHGKHASRAIGHSKVRPAEVVEVLHSAGGADLAL